MKAKATVEETSNINDSTSSSITIILGKGLCRRRRRRGPGSDGVPLNRSEEDDNNDDNDDSDTLDGPILRPSYGVGSLFLLLVVSCSLLFRRGSSSRRQ